MSGWDLRPASERPQGRTIWTARRLGDRILCGRQVPPGGPYACKGELGTIVADIGDEKFFRPRAGVVAEYFEGEYGPRFRKATRTRWPDHRNQGSFPIDRMTRRGRPTLGAFKAPLWCPCDLGHENHLPEGILDVLES